MSRSLFEEGCDVLKQKMEMYEDSYRNKICSKCNQKRKRGCRIDVRGLRYCGHMKRARDSYFKRELKDLWDLRQWYAEKFRTEIMGLKKLSEVKKK